MTDRQTYDLEMATYPLIPELVDAPVPIPDEIRCLLDAGWKWDGDKLVNPQNNNIWRRYKRIDSPKVCSERFDAEIKQALRETRWREQRIASAGDEHD
jgi:hypothetical protein